VVLVERIVLSGGLAAAAVLAQLVLTDLQRAAAQVVLELFGIHRSQQRLQPR
jgi:ABC-type molybdenum transport system ATPase subunit/photorepair protein PhrA